MTPKRQLERYRNDPEYRKYHIEYQKNYQKQRYQEDPNYRERIKNYHKTPEGFETDKKHKAKRRRNLSTGSVSFAEWCQIIKDFCNRCAYCFKSFTVENPPTMDHIIALVLGGRHEAGNIAPACGHCNSIKHATPLWMLPRLFKEDSLISSKEGN